MTCFRFSQYVLVHDFGGCRVSFIVSVFQIRSIQLQTDWLNYLSETTVWKFARLTGIRNDTIENMLTITKIAIYKYNASMF